MTDINFYNKYLKYKNKYLRLKKQNAGSIIGAMSLTPLYAASHIVRGTVKVAEGALSFNPYRIGAGIGQTLIGDGVCLGLNKEECYGPSFSCYWDANKNKCLLT